MNASTTEGLVITLPAQADIAAATFIGATGVQASAAAAADETMAVGVALSDAAAGTHVAVQCSGIARVKAGADLAAGQSVGVDSAGLAQPATGAAVGKTLANCAAGGIASVLLFAHRAS